MYLSMSYPLGGSFEWKNWESQYCTQRMGRWLFISEVRKFQVKSKLMEKLKELRGSTEAEMAHPHDTDVIYKNQRVYIKNSTKHLNLFSL